MFVCFLTLLAFGDDPAVVPEVVRPPRDVEALRRDLDPNVPAETRMDALWEALGHAGKDGPLVAEVRRCAAATEPEVRGVALAVLTYAASFDKRPVPDEALAALEDPSIVVQRRVVEPLSLFDSVPASVETALIRLAGDSDVYTRGHALSALGNIENATDDVVRALRKGTSDDAPLVRGHAAAGLWNHGGERSLAVAVWLRAHADSPAVPDGRGPTADEEIAQIAAFAAAMKFKAKSEEEPEAFAKALAVHLNGPSPALRRVAAQQVYAGSIFSKGMREASRPLVPRLRELLEDEDVRTRAWASQALELLAD